LRTNRKANLIKLVEIKLKLKHSRPSLAGKVDELKLLSDKQAYYFIELLIN